MELGEEQEEIQLLNYKKLSLLYSTKFIQCISISSSQLGIWGGTVNKTG